MPDYDSIYKYDFSYEQLRDYAEETESNEERNLKYPEEYYGF